MAENYTVRAIYTHVEFAFTSSIGAIGGGAIDADLLNFLTAYLRSPIVTFLLVMTGYSVIGERPRIAIKDMRNFPFCAPEHHPDPMAAKEIVAKVAAIFDSLAKIPEWQRGHSYFEKRKILDDLVFDYFRLSPSDRLLVGDIVGVVAASIQPADYARLVTPLLHRPSKNEIAGYVDILARELEDWRKRSGGIGGLKIDAVVDGANGFFGAVRIGIDVGGEDQAGLAQSESAFQGLLADINAGLAIQLDSADQNGLFKLPNAMIVVDDVFYFIKPMRRRFWLSRIALSDADHIARTVQAAAWDRFPS